ncbi:hypothetical protein F5Y16DRAFT_90362 [Xylariaceae sp. FL0255]|nr:hypothetical protein F5Y16DRAFT_90362 [Xylariaceae sp. FL0255]
MQHDCSIPRILALGAWLSLASATSIRSPWLLERDNTCAANYSKCAGTGLPANFCCQTGQDCIVLAGNTTVLCCPSGVDCSVIEPINCNISLQDASTNPTAEVKTTELDEKLPTCGTGCCPFGYHCDTSSKNCVEDTDQSQKPGASTSTTAPASPSTSSPSTTTSQGTTSATNTPATTDAATSATPSANPTAAKVSNTASIAGGVVGALFGLFLIGACFWFVRRRRHKREAENDRDSTASFGNIISHPMQHKVYGERYNTRQHFPTRAQSSSVSTPMAQVQDRFAPQSPYAYRSDSHTGGEQDSPRSHHMSAEVHALQGRDLTGRRSVHSQSQSIDLNNDNEGTFRDQSEDTEWDELEENEPIDHEEKKRNGSGGSQSILIGHEGHGPYPAPAPAPAPSSEGLGLQIPNMASNRLTTWSNFQEQAAQMPTTPTTPVRRRH